MADENAFDLGRNPQRQDARIARLQAELDACGRHANRLAEEHAAALATARSQGRAEGRMAGLQNAIDVLEERGAEETHPDNEWACDYAARIIRAHTDALLRARAAVPAPPAGGEGER